MGSTREKAEFFAELANIEDLKSLSDTDQAQLIINCVKAGLVNSFFTKATVSHSPEAAKSWKGDPANIPGAWWLIGDVHEWAQKLIGGFVDSDKPVDVRAFEKELIRSSRRPETWVKDKKLNRVVAQPIITGALFVALEEVIKADPFPFSRCGVCKNIFVPNKNQKYCSKPCATKALAPWKNKYMKKYMKDKRAVEKGGKGGNRKN